MKSGIHPEYVEAQVVCSCGNTFTTRATKPSLHVELCSECHPFYTGKQKLVDSGGRVERFRRRYASVEGKARTGGRAARKPATPAAAEEATAPTTPESAEGEAPEA